MRCDGSQWYFEHGRVTIKEAASSNTGPLIVGPTKNYATRPIDIPRKLADQLCDYRPHNMHADITHLVFPNSKGATSGTRIGGRTFG